MYPATLVPFVKKIPLTPGGSTIEWLPIVTRFGEVTMIEMEKPS